MRRVLLPSLIVLLFATLARAQVRSRANVPVDFSLSVSGALGNLASTAGATLLQACTIAANPGHFTNLVLVTDLNGSSCTTAPTYNIRNNTQSTTGTAKIAGTSAGVVNQAETLTFNAGDTICLVRTVNGATCATPVFTVAAEFSQP